MPFWRSPPREIETEWGITTGIELTKEGGAEDDLE
jgi:hypothetical protein